MIVLVVEDEALVASDLAMELEAAGHTVLGPAATPDEALALVSRQRPDLALVDINLCTRGDGVELAKRLCAEHQVTCVFASGQTGEAREHRSAAVGLIPKPYDLDTAVETVEAVGDLLRGHFPQHAVRGFEWFVDAPPAGKL